MLRLFYGTGTIAVATAITLEESGLDYRLVKLDFASGEQTKPDYHVINPKGRVPALVTDNGVLTETGALLDYIAALAPEANLIPVEPFLAAKMREVMYYLASTMHVNHAHKMRGSRWADQENSFQDMTAKVAETMTASCAFIEANYPVNPFVLGKEISLADPYLFTILNWAADDGVDMDAFPRLTAFLAMMEQRPSVKATRGYGVL
jgi:glutathione S-transferase